MAYDVLSDSTSRQEYNQQLGQATTSSDFTHQSKIRLSTVNIWSYVSFSLNVLYADCQLFDIICLALRDKTCHLQHFSVM